MKSTDAVQSAIQGAEKNERKMEGVSRPLIQIKNLHIHLDERMNSTTFYYTGNVADDGDSCECCDDEECDHCNKDEDDSYEKDESGKGMSPEIAVLAFLEMMNNLKTPDRTED